MLHHALPVFTKLSVGSLLRVVIGADVPYKVRVKEFYQSVCVSRPNSGEEAGVIMYMVYVVMSVVVELAVFQSENWLPISAFQARHGEASLYAHLRVIGSLPTR